MFAPVRRFAATSLTGLIVLAAVVLGLFSCTGGFDEPAARVASAKPARRVPLSICRVSPPLQP